METYKEVNGTHYCENTPEAIIKVLENARSKNIRLKIHYGDTETGKDWNEQFDTTGYVGRSCGPKIKAPLLIHNTRSMGGGMILTDCIVKIVTSKGKQVLYQHPKYN